MDLWVVGTCGLEDLWIVGCGQNISHTGSVRCGPMDSYVTELLTGLFLKFPEL